MDNSLQAQAERWTTYTAPEFMDDDERDAYFQIKGILALHPAEIGVADYKRIGELAQYLEKRQRERNDTR